MPTAQIRDDLSLAYTDTGEGPALMLITGLGGLKEGWFRQVPALSEGFRVITFDNRGMGGSSVVDAPCTMEDMAEDAVLLLDHLGIERAHVWGVSMGGKIAQVLARDHSQRVDHLVLENTTPGGGNGESPLKRAYELDAQGWLDEVVPLLFGAAYIEKNQGSMRAFARSRERNPPDPVGLARQWEAYEAFDNRARLHEISAPTLVLVGAEDGLTDTAHSEALAAGIPVAQLRWIEGGGHSVHIELPEVVNEAVRSFLG